MIASLLILALIVTVLYIASHDLSGFQVAGVCAFFAVGIVLVAFPDLTSMIARASGVGRGADLITYLSIVGGLFVGANLYFRSRRADRQLVGVVRELAIMRAELTEDRLP
jgi:hypothetical protein